MRILGNVIWFCCGGILVAFINFILGLILTALVVTAPIGLGLLQFSKFCLFPFSYTMVSKKDAGIKQNALWKSYSSIVMVVYVVLFGWWNFLLSLAAIFMVFLTIIGIPVAIAMSKCLGTTFNPVGKICVPVAVAKELEKRKAQEQVDKYLNEDEK